MAGRYSDDVLEDLVTARLEAIIASIDRKIGLQLDAILHHPKFQRLERVWRSIALLVERTDFGENIEIALYPCTLDELRVDLVRWGVPPTKTAFYAITAIAPGDRPYGAIIADFEVDPSDEDVALLDRIREVAMTSLAPFIAAASPRFFGDGDRSCVRSITRTDHFEKPVLAAFRALRENPGASMLGLTVGRFTLRAPHVIQRDATDERPGFTYTEQIASPEDACWGLATAAFATRLTDSFARYRWCPNIVGAMAGGALGDLPRVGDAIGPVDVNISERGEYELSEQGFIPMMFLDASTVCFFSARSVQRPLYFGASEEARAAEMNHRLGTELPYVFMMTRIGQYLQIVHRSFKPTWEASIKDEEHELEDWLGQYCADREVVPASLRGRRVLRRVQVFVKASESDPSWREFDMRVRPHFKFMGMFFTLKLQGNLTSGTSSAT